MKKRIISAVLLLPLFLAILLAAPKWAAAVLFSVMAAIASFELLYNTGMVKHIRLVIYSCIAAFLVPIWCHFGMKFVFAQLGITVFFVLIFVEMMLSHIKLRFDKVAVCFVAAFLLPYMLANPVRIMNVYSGRYMVLLPFVAAFMGDTGAYFIGRAFGHKKLAPVISPNKTVEGLIGGIAFGVISMIGYGLVLQFVFHLEINYVYALVYGALGAVCGAFGDLCFSVIKRQTGIKDFGNLIPGHGGILDRFDACIVVGCFMEILIQWIPMVVKNG